MKQEELAENLYKSHRLFIEYINALTKEEFMFRPTEKWTAGQQLDHIYRSTKPLAQALLLPAFAIKMIIGKANRPSRTYDELVSKYLSKLQLGGKASGRFVPEEIPFEQKEKLIKSLNGTIEKLVSRLSRFSEVELETVILPHPLLGKLTLREMIYFTIYHAQHHEEITKRNLLNAGVK